MKKSIAILVSIFLLLSVFQMPVSAATIVSEVGVEVVPPTAGKWPNYDSRLSHDSYITDDETNSYKEGGITWYHGDTPMYQNESFELGEVYTVRVELLRANEEYEFQVNPNVVATINGNDAYISYVNANYLIIEYTFPAVEGYTVSFNSGGGTGVMNPIFDVPCELILPECTFTAPEGRQFNGWSVGGTNGVFEPGETVHVYDDITVTALWKDKEAERQTIYDFVATSEDIDSIPSLYGRIKIPSFTVVEGAPAYINATTSNFRWMKKIGDTWEIQYDNRFTPGEWRAFAAVRIDRESSYTHKLGNPTTLTVNGEKWEPENGTGKPYVSAEFSQIFFMSPIYVIEDDPNIAPPVPVESVNLRIEGYQAEMQVANATILCDDNIDVLNWNFLEAIDADNDGQYDSSINATGEFSTDKTYAVQLIISPQSGYDISNLEPSDISMENSIESLLKIYNEGNETFLLMYMLKPVEAHEHSMLKIISPASINEAGQIQHFCEFCEEFSVEKIEKIKEIKLFEPSYTYDGKEKNPLVTVFDEKDERLMEGMDFSVAYSSGRKDIGKYTVTVTFNGNYSGEVTESFTIIPKGTKLKSLSKGKKKIKVKWKKQNKQTTGYQLQYSTKKNFKGAKTTTVKKNKTVSKTLSKLKSKTKYYVRIRTYKTVGGKKYYSLWSSKKNIKTK